MRIKVSLLFPSSTRDDEHEIWVGVIELLT